jgi:peptidoglycan hydrolase-like protein with peptidoglycan-binding domain
MIDEANPQVAPPSAVGFVALQSGQIVGRYEIIDVLGHGGFGITYRARDTRLDREVAIKEYLPAALAVRQGGTTVLPRSTESAADFAWGRDRFVSEGQTLASLENAPAIVRLFDFIEANGTAYIVMELVRGETVESRLRRVGRLSAVEVDAILWPLLDGLARVHDAGFLHRDIKPANILLDEAGAPTLIDFGASRAAMVGRSTLLTAIFTPGFAAAEQFTSARQGPWTDIYGLSATLYNAITGRVPPSSFDRMLDDDYQPLIKLAPAGFAFARLAGIDNGLAVRAADRPQSIAAWRDILSRDADATVAVRRLAARSPKSKPAAASARSRRIAVYAGAAVAILALAMGGYFLLAAKPQPQQVALQDMKVEDLEKALEARRRADAEAAEKRRLEEEAQKKAAADAEAKQAADAALAKAQLEREQAEAELVKVKAELEAQKKAAALQTDGVRQAAAEEAQRKAEAEAEARRQAEADARRKAAAEAEAQRLADQALAQAQAERERAEAEAKAKAEAEARQTAEADAKIRAEVEARAKEKADAEAAENGLRLTQTDRQRLQVALTAQGFDTRGTDGAFGPRTREMVAAWQKARNQSATGFLNAAQRQQLQREAAAALQKYDDDKKKAEEDKKKAEEEAKKKADEEAKAKAATAAPSTATAPAVSTFDGTYSGVVTLRGGNLFVSITLTVSGGSASGQTSDRACGALPFTLAVSPAGQISGSARALDSAVQACVFETFSVSGKVNGGVIELELSRPGTRGRGTLKKG